MAYRPGITGCAMLLALALSAPASGQLRAEVVASGLSRPLELVQDPADPSIQYIVEQSGVIRVLAGGRLLPQPFLDIRGSVSSFGERGLLGLAFPSDYAASRRFYVDFTDTAGNTVVARFTRSAADRLVADAASRFDLRWGGASGQRFIVQPFTNHNGGHLEFGPDGYLYVALGDGGSGCTAVHESQNPNTYLGKILRIDVSVADGDLEGYRVPPDNPFLPGNGPIVALPEIWSFGWRNPWKFTFDSPGRGGTGAMIVADVGERSWEEFNYEPRARGGRNYGWCIREGNAAAERSGEIPPFGPLRAPTFEYPHAVGRSITGGFVYRGARLHPSFRGRYFFADFEIGRVWSIALSIDPATGEAAAGALTDHTAELGALALGNISALGVDAGGELYLVNWSSGTILRIVPRQVARAIASDFDGNGQADPTVFRPSEGRWYAATSRTPGATPFIRGWGIATDVPVPGDYDGDGRADPAFFRPDEGRWYLTHSAGGGYRIVSWGISTDVPVPADYDGDGRTDIAVFRPDEGVWLIAFSGSEYVGHRAVRWGISTDVPVAGDYDGDGRDDVAIFRPEDGLWFITFASSNFTAYRVVRWGIATDRLVPADYDADGITDIAIFRPDEGRWFILIGGSGFQYWRSVQFGISTDTPAPRDFDGDGAVDVAVFRRMETRWLALLRSGVLFDYTFGAAGDRVVPPLPRAWYQPE